MTQLPFHKYQATGNDFIVIDNLNGSYLHSEQLAKKLCDRKFGIGSDGLILIQSHTDFDFEMVFYNPDGSMSLCGNGSRCAVNFARKLGLIEDSCTFLAYDGPHEASIMQNKTVRLKMNDVHSVRSMNDGTFVDTGSPHLMVFVEDVNDFDVYENGKKIRNNETFKSEGVNVNFVQKLEQSSIFVRTYERGVECETLSCGTGVTAAAIAANGHDIHSPVIILTKGGNLQVEFKKLSDTEFTDVYLIGPAKAVFTGTIELD